MIDNTLSSGDIIFSSKEEISKNFDNIYKTLLNLLNIKSDDGRKFKNNNVNEQEILIQMNNVLSLKSKVLNSFEINTY